MKYHCHKNIGARNLRHAFKSIDTTYFSILSDDFLSKDFYNDAIDVLENNPETMFVILNTFRIDENSNLIAWESTNTLTFLQRKEDLMRHILEKKFLKLGQAWYLEKNLPVFITK